MELIGKQVIDFTKDGERIVGIKLHLLDQVVYVEGRVALTYFFRKDHPCYHDACNASLGPITFVYGPRNRIVNIIQKA